MAAPTAGVARKAKAATAAVEMVVKYMLLWMMFERLESRTSYLVVGSGCGEDVFDADGCDGRERKYWASL